MKNLILLILLIFTSCAKKEGEGIQDPGPQFFPPRQLTYTNSSLVFANQIEITPMFPRYFGGEATSFAISPNLPNGLSFSSLSGRIAGTPEGLSAPKIYTVTASNEYGSTSFNITLEVKAQVPFGLRYLSDELNLLKGLSSVSLVPEFNLGVRGGASIVSFSISPANLPSGLRFNTATGAIEGSATETFPRTVYTVTGINSGGSISTEIAIKVETLVSSLRSGGKHNCLIEDSQAKCWGDNSFGQIGNGTNVSSGLLVPAVIPGGVRSLYSGSEYSCAINNSFEIYCWGRNQSGQLGSSIMGDKNTPTLFDTFGRHISLSLSKGKVGETNRNYHTCGVDLFEGETRCWGSFDFGSLAQDDYEVRYSNNTLVTYPSIMSSSSNSVCFESDGLVSCLGGNNLGQLGDGGASGLSSTVAVPTSPLPDRVSVLTSGENFHCSIVLNDVYCWGQNDRGQLGRASYLSSFSASPIMAENMPEFIFEIKAGSKFACALAGQKLYCWGDNSRGQLGQLVAYTSQMSATPVIVKKEDGSELSNITEFSLGEEHACAISENKVYCWGDNSSRQSNNSTTPIIYGAKEISL